MKSPMNMRNDRNVMMHILILYSSEGTDEYDLNVSFFMLNKTAIAAIHSIAFHVNPRLTFFMCEDIRTFTYKS